MVYGIIGTGAIGGYYGGKLAHAGHEVNFLFHSDYDYVCGHGLQVNSCLGSFHIDNVRAYSSAAEMPKCDVVIVGLKTTREQLLATLLPPLLRSDTLVVLIQNGIGVEEHVARMLPGVSLAAGLAFICSTKTRPGIVDHADMGSINIAAYNCSGDARVSSLVSDLRGAGVEAQEVEYHEARWKKAVWNVPFNGLTVALGARTDAILASPAGESLCRDMMREVVEAARACGVERIGMDFAEQMIAKTRRMVPYAPSMKVDYDHHRPMEIEFLYERPAEIARRHGYEMKRAEMLAQELHFLEGHHGAE